LTETTGHILVVDDNRLNRLKLLHSLEQQGYTVVLAENGRQALDLLRQQSFDVVLLDIIMPEMDGYEVLGQMKADTALRSIPVIVISALDEVESTVRCIEMGAEDYLPKPFNPVFLRARLESSLRKKKLRDLEQAYLQQEVTLRQNEKLATLGRLSAGMAHELNNPAAAAVRGASHLIETISQLQQAMFNFTTLELTAEQLQTLHSLDNILHDKAGRPSGINAITRSDLEYAVETWLDEQGVEEGWIFSSTLVELGYDEQQLASLSATLSLGQLPTVLAWLNSAYNTYSLLQEIGQGTERISIIVKALKTYSYLDQAPIQIVDIHEGLDNTLIVLHGKLKTGIMVERQYSSTLPRIEAYGSELNQVWTNIIDNAIDAMSGEGELKIKSYQDNNWVVVEITDNGSGIPPDIQPHIFDPFFTTKPPSSGTGLGLNISHNIIVQKHEGMILVESKPGRTCFQVKLPLTISN
jgi:signal transduction histidine kinase